jgi:ATP-dependent exoDNAse (exonuclease V) alpha subunit
MSLHHLGNRLLIAPLDFEIGHLAIALRRLDPGVTQHFKMLFRNLIYTALTRAKNLAVFVGTRKALAMAVKNQDTSQRQTFLEKLLRP